MQTNETAAMITLMKQYYLSNQLWKNLERINSQTQQAIHQSKHKDIDIYDIYDHSINNLHLTNLTMLNHWNAVLTTKQQLRWTKYLYPYRILSIELETKYHQAIDTYPNYNLNRPTHIDWSTYQPLHSHKLATKIQPYKTQCLNFNQVLLSILENKPIQKPSIWSRIFKRG